MATAIKGRAHRISLGEDFLTGARWAFGWIRQRPDRYRNVLTPQSPLTFPWRYRRSSDLIIEYSRHSQTKAWRLQLKVELTEFLSAKIF